jgi:putative hydroxymethylpyrimidine transporter CytX
MALFANHVSQQVFGFHAFTLWLIVVASGCTALALLGPIRVVQAWLEKAGIWIVLVTCGYLTVYLVTKIDLGSLLTAPHSGVSFGLGVDLVVAQPVSWLPLVADYNRFSAGRSQNFLGTLGGYSIGNIWFYGLGALLVLAAKLEDPSPAGIAAAVLGLSAGAVVGTLLLVSLLAGETDEAFADIYSTVVSAQNIVPGLPRRTAIISVGVAGAVIAGFVTVGNYQTFLFLLGSVFVPLFAVLLADWCAGSLRRTHRLRRLRWGDRGDRSDRGDRGPLGPRAPEPPLRPGMTLVWLLGIAEYHWIVPTGPSWWTDIVTKVPGAGKHTFLGASLPCFAVTFVSALIVTAAVSRRGRREELLPQP